MVGRTRLNRGFEVVWRSKPRSTCFLHFFLLSFVKSAILKHPRHLLMKYKLAWHQILRGVWKNVRPLLSLRGQPERPEVVKHWGQASRLWNTKLLNTLKNGWADEVKLRFWGRFEVKTEVPNFADILISRSSPISFAAGLLKIVSSCFGCKVNVYFHGTAPKCSVAWVNVVML